MLQGIEPRERFFRSFGECAHFVGHDGETSAMVSGASRLDSGIEGKQIRLIGDITDCARNLANTPGLRFQIRNQFHGTQLPRRAILDRCCQGLDMTADLDEKRLQSLVFLRETSACLRVLGEMPPNS